MLVPKYKSMNLEKRKMIFSDAEMVGIDLNCILHMKRVGEVLEFIQIKEQFYRR
jgi:hypothetical protein